MSNERIYTDENDDILDAYLSKLTTPEVPRYVKARWIVEQLPGLTSIGLSNWIRHGIITPSLGSSARGRDRLLTHEEAEGIGYIWYFRVKGSSFKEAVSKTRTFLKEEPL